MFIEQRDEKQLERNTDIPLTRPITIDDIVNLANANPDRTNPVDNVLVDASSGCFYFAPDGTPGCIIGNVVASLGGDSTDVIEDTGPLDMLNLFIDVLTAEYASRVQEYADNGTPWGEVINLA